MFRAKKNAKSRKGIVKYGNLTPAQYRIMEKVIEAANEKAANGSTISRAAILLDMKEGTLRANLHWIKLKYEKCKSVTRAIEDRQRKLPQGAKRYFTG